MKNREGRWKPKTMTVAQHGKIMACQAKHFSMVNHKPQKTTYITLDGTRTVFWCSTCVISRFQQRKCVSRIMNTWSVNAMNDVESSLRAHLEDLVWQPPEDTLGRKRLQTQISLCLKELLKCTLTDDAKKRSRAFEVLQGTSQSWKLSG